MSVAQIRLAELATWIAQSSANRRAPLGGDLSVGMWAVIIPVDLSQPPPLPIDPEALPLFVDATLANGVATGPVVTTAPDSQDHMASRLSHLIWKVTEGYLPRVAIIGLDDPEEALQDAIDRAAIAYVDTNAVPILCVPFLSLSTAHRAAISLSLPVALAP
tara:strand:+ start:6517 stop:6999 length:483 start_codon:yes stop_codon:yes gene_type:complete